MGQAISPLRDEGILLFGSGMSFHNMRGFTRSSGGAVGSGGAVSAALAASKARACLGSCPYLQSFLEDLHLFCSAEASGLFQCVDP